MKYSVIGQRVPLEDAFEKVTGSIKYATDIKLPEMLYAKVLRSPYPHANVVNIDTSKAEALPGVEAVITPDDVPEEEWLEESFNYYGRVLHDTVRFVGDEVAAVAAINEDVAEEALDLIEVEYEELPSVFTIEDAMKPGSVQVNPHGNIRQPSIVEWGNLEVGFKEAEFIFENQTTMESQQHAPIGLNACIAQWENDKLTIWVSSHTPFEIRDVVARYLKMPLSKVRVIGLPTGGSFGLFWLNVFHFIPIFLAKKARKPVKFELSRQEIFATVKRRDVPISQVKLGVKKDGSFTVIHMKHYFDNGAYGFKSNPYESESDLWVRNAKHGKFEFYGVSTNLLTAGCMRGVGDMSESFCVEQVIDKAAEKLGMSPLDIRLKNHSRAGDRVRGDMFFYLATGLPVPEKYLSSSALDKCIKEGAKAIGWEKKWKGWGKPVAVNGNKRRGIGMAVASHCCGQRYLGCPSVIVKINHDGSVNLITGVARLGQGVETSQAQICAEELGVPIESIKGTHGDTDSCPWNQATVASTCAHITGIATRAAAADAKRKICELAATVIGALPENLDIKEGKIFVKGQPRTSIPITDITDKILTADGTAYGPTIIGSSAKNIPLSPVARMFMAHFVEVDVDTTTGKVDIIKYVAAHDSGTIINPSIAESQVVGGIFMGAGIALSERLIFDEANGQVLNPNFVDYKLLRAYDMPVPEVIFVENVDPVGAFGIKGIGEGVVAPVPTAIVQAIHNATGIRFNSIPVTPEKLLNALKNSQLS